VTLSKGGSHFAGLVGRSTESLAFKDFDKILAKLDTAALSRVANRMERIQRKRVSFSDITLEDGRVDTALAAEIFNSNKSVILLINLKHRSEYSGVGEAVYDVKYSV